MLTKKLILVSGTIFFTGATLGIVYKNYGKNLSEKTLPEKPSVENKIDDKKELTFSNILSKIKEAKRKNALDDISCVEEVVVHKEIMNNYDIVYLKNSPGDYFLRIPYSRFWSKGVCVIHCPCHGKYRCKNVEINGRDKYSHIPYYDLPILNYHDESLGKAVVAYSKFCKENSLLLQFKICTVQKIK